MNRRIVQLQNLYKRTIQNKPDYYKLVMSNEITAWYMCMYDFIFRIELSLDYPLVSPVFVALTPQGVFKPNCKICTAGFESTDNSTINQYCDYIMSRLICPTDDDLQTDARTKEGFRNNAIEYNKKFLGDVILLIN